MTGTTLGLGVQHQVSWIAGTPGLAVLYNAIEHWVSWCMAGTTGPVVYHMGSSTTVYGWKNTWPYGLWQENWVSRWCMLARTAETLGLTVSPGWLEHWVSQCSMMTTGAGTLGLSTWVLLEHLPGLTMSR